MQNPYTMHSFVRHPAPKIAHSIQRRPAIYLAAQAVWTPQALALTDKFPKERPSVARAISYEALRRLPEKSRAAINLIRKDERYGSDNRSAARGFLSRAGVWPTVLNVAGNLELLGSISLDGVQWLVSSGIDRVVPISIVGDPLPARRLPTAESVAKHGTAKVAARIGE
jgi:hypothetical protein